VTLPAIGSLVALSPAHHPHLLADSVRLALASWPRSGGISVAEIDPDLADTDRFARAYGVALTASANCVVVAGRRDGAERVAACVVLATTRADVNGGVRRLLDVRKASFLPVDRAVAESGMEYGGITPIGLPPGWRILVDAAVAALDVAVIGSGVRRSKLVLSGPGIAAIPGAEVVDGLGVPGTTG
jgi:prolyl-tRNA editing enzyme YbaK/EbsC (Cys-tRNA(Pro) deacylase)